MKTFVDIMIINEHLWICLAFTQEGNGLTSLWNTYQLLGQNQYTTWYRKLNQVLQITFPRHLHSCHLTELYVFSIMKHLCTFQRLLHSNLLRLEHAVFNRKRRPGIAYWSRGKLGIRVSATDRNRTLNAGALFPATRDQRERRERG